MTMKATISLRSLLQIRDTCLAAPEGAFEETVAGCCLGRSLVEASVSLGVARLLFHRSPRAAAGDPAGTAVPDPR
jgi:hypothetical protein